MKEIPCLTPDLTEWAMRQPVFFIATAPRHGRHVNVSPKGLPSTTLAFLTPTRVAYVDRTGSGCETVAHLYENGRATVMFMSLGASPRILRLYCAAREVAEWTDGGRFGALLAEMGGLGRPASPRAVVVLDVFKVTTSCGYGVPMVRRELYAAGTGTADECSVFQERPTLEETSRKKAVGDAFAEYQRLKNAYSLDGLPGLKAARRGGGPAGALAVWLQNARARLAAQGEGVAVGLALGLLLAWLLATVAAAWSPAAGLGGRG